MTKDKRTRQTRVITVRMTEEEYKAIKEASQAAEQSMNTFMLESVLEEARSYFDPETETIANG